mgnify:CR=1 FL=1
MDRFVNELENLRTQGLQVYDALTGNHFVCKADYFGIIGDLPAVANAVCFKVSLGLFKQAIQLFKTFDRKEVTPN